MAQTNSLNSPFYRSIGDFSPMIYIEIDSTIRKLITYSLIINRRFSHFFLIFMIKDGKKFMIQVFLSFVNCLLIRNFIRLTGIGRELE